MLMEQSLEPSILRSEVQSMVQLNGAESLLDFCRLVPHLHDARDLDVLQLGTPERLPRLEPILLDAMHEAIWQHGREVSPDTFSTIGPEPWLGCLDNALVMGKLLTVSDQRGRIITESFVDRPRLLTQIHPELPGTFPVQVQVDREIDAEVVLLGGPWSGAFYHWINDMLPRHRFFAEPLQGRDLWYLSSPLAPYQAETLAALGIPPERVIPHSAGVTRCRRLWLPSRAGHHMSTTPRNIAWLRQHFGQQDSAAPEKIYISRRDTERRRILNEDVLIKRLLRRGFTIIQGDEGSFQEQVRRFSRATLVVAPHGGALTHMAFTPPGATMIELIPHTHVTFPFYNIARCAGHQYLFIMTDADPETSDFVAPLDLLDTVLG